MVPTLGESVTEATVSTWFKKVGDTVAARRNAVRAGNRQGQRRSPRTRGWHPDRNPRRRRRNRRGDGKLAVIPGPPVPQPPAKPRPAAAPQPPHPARTSKTRHPPKSDGRSRHRRDQVTGTGRDGRVMKEDVPRRSPPAPLQPRPLPPPARPSAADDAAREERVKMTRLRQTIARRLKDSQNTAAMLTTYNEVDMTEVMALRNEYKDLFDKKHGVKLGFMSFFTKACCHALNEVPEVNAEIDGTDVVYKNYVHMGVAAGTPTGLVVPVIRDADQMSLPTSKKPSAKWAQSP